MQNYKDLSKKQQSKILALAQEAIRLKFDHEQCALSCITYIDEAFYIGADELGEDLTYELSVKAQFSKGFIRDSLASTKQRREDADAKNEILDMAASDHEYQQELIAREGEIERL